ncbi:MAG: iron-containing alcohol dehydrogenase, partial [Mycoplasmatales bacterium]
RVIWNSPSTFGGIGDVYNSFIPSLTLGCGSYGKNSVSNNVGAFDLLNIKRLGARRNNMQWFKIPSKIYFEPGSIKYLSEMAGVERVFIVADKAMEELGFVNDVIYQLDQRDDKVAYEVFSDIEPDPDITTVMKGTEAMRSFNPDHIIAIGGGSVMDAAKIMWLFFEKPEVDFKDLYQKFIDIRKRAFKYGSLGEKAKFVAIPTTSGTGSEVTPFAVISDKSVNKKYPLADYSLTPTIAILDPNFVMGLPSVVAAHTGLDVLTHAVESYVSILANDLTDGLALHAIKLVFENLAKSVNDRDPKAREKMHNASTLAGMSFANSFLGINHSLAHKLGGQFHTVHGQTNAILMPYVIKYNSCKPAKLSLWPKYTEFVADQRYAEIAAHIGLKFKTTEEGVAVLIKAIQDLTKEIGVESTLKELNIDEKDFIKNVPAIALLAYEDQCTPANPRLPLVKDMEQILLDAYYGKKL